MSSVKLSKQAQKAIYNERAYAKAKEEKLALNTHE
jgi:hypothetical protein